jgi:hypothetical protein
MAVESALARGGPVRQLNQAVAVVVGLVMLLALVAIISGVAASQHPQDNQWNPDAPTEITIYPEP